jgi:predicted AAA+ superfamily ATPase
MFPDPVINVLVADNPWLEGDDKAAWIERHLPDPYIERSVRLELGARAGLVIGPRQAGKSTLIWKTLSTMDAPCLYVNCEEPAIRDWARSPALFVQGLERLVPPESVVFLEEVQNLEDAGLFLKGLVDRRSGHRFVATGSSSYELEARTRESLAGRADRHLLLPFSLAELVAAAPGPAALGKRRAESISEELIIHGGYPSIHLADKREAALTGLVESFVIRDASDRFRLRHTAAFRKLLELMASQIGNLCNNAAWAAILGVSADTVADYAAILGDAHVVKLVRPFVGGKRAEITSTPKVYFVDNGVRNRLFGGFAPLGRRPDKGALLENYVFTELYKHLNPLLDSIRFWRSKSKAEVDFVIERAGRIIGVEVKAGPSRSRLTRAAHSFIDAYEPAELWIVSDEEHAAFRVENTDILFATPSMIRTIPSATSSIRLIRKARR